MPQDLEIERLRGIVRAVVAHGYEAKPDGDHGRTACFFCDGPFSNRIGNYQHRADCLSRELEAAISATAKEGD